MPHSAPPPPPPPPTFDTVPVSVPVHAMHYSYVLSIAAQLYLTSGEAEVECLAIRRVSEDGRHLNPFLFGYHPQPKQMPVKCLTFYCLFIHEYNVISTSP